MSAAADRVISNVPRDMTLVDFCALMDIPGAARIECDRAGIILINQFGRRMRVLLTPVEIFH